MDNLALAFGDQLDDRGRRRLARACWQHFGRITIDTLCFRRFGPDDVGRRVRYEGLEHVREAEIGNKDIQLEYIEEAYTTEHWLDEVNAEIEAEEQSLATGS